jgi:hypothetical protein
MNLLSPGLLLPHIHTILQTTNLAQHNQPEEPEEEEKKEEPEPESEPSWHNKGLVQSPKP